MAFTVDYTTFIITVPQSDLTLVSGTLYTHDTEAFRDELKAWEDDELGIVWPDTHVHATEVTVVGTTYARFINMIRPFSIEYEDGVYSVRQEGSNNNLFDVENGILQQNQVQVIPTNSAGLIKNATSLTQADIDAIRDEVWDAPVSGMTDSTTIGGYIAKKLLKFAKWIALK